MQVYPYLLSPYQLNTLFTLRNRVVMAPMTRVNATHDFVPTDKMTLYYQRRADAGLIVTEGTVIRRDAVGYPHVPGIFNQAQIDAWHKVTDAVHAKSGLIFLQIWHVGRVTDQSLIENQLPLSASATEMTGKVSRSPHLSYGRARAATQDEIKYLIEDYAKAAKNARIAGFDGIEIHGANGYLIDQFLHHDTNQREDNYGGTPENMARFALDVVKACGDAISYERVGLRLSPAAYLNQIKADVRDADVFAYLLSVLNQYPIAYVHTGNFNDAEKFQTLHNNTMTAFIRTHYHGNVIASGGYTPHSAEEGLHKNEFDLVAIGRPFIANSDYVHRITDNLPLTPYDVSMLAHLE